MGNACVAGGGAPHKIDIIIINNTKYSLELDTSQECGRECRHSGFIITDGKIVEGSEPPALIQPFNKGSFSASGRDSTAVAPKGKVFYRNEEKNLQVIFEWCHSGWTSREAASADATVVGARTQMMKNPQPWADFLEVKTNPDSWIYTLQEKDGKFDRAVEAVKDLGKTVGKFKVI